MAEELTHEDRRVQRGRAVECRFTARPLAKSSHFALVEGAGVFWHMVDLLWIVIFALVYLVE